MSKIEELKLTAIELATELHRAKLPATCCPYRYFGNPDNVDLDCNTITCTLCKARYFQEYQEKMTAYINKHFDIVDPKVELAKSLARLVAGVLNGANEKFEESMEGYEASSYLAGFNYAIDKVRGLLTMID